LVIIGGTSFVVAGVTPDHLTFCNSPNDTAKNTDFIQKSAPEKLNKKSKFYGTFEPVIKKDMIISGSTSELLIKINKHITATIKLRMELKNNLFLFIF